MPIFEYKVVPAPTKGVKERGLKRPEDRFALALSQVMNALGAEGWEYIRADILPAQERSGLASKQTVYHTLLVFRRPLADSDTATLPDMAETPAPLALDSPASEPEPPTPATDGDAPSDAAPEPQEDDRPPLAAQ